MSLRKQYSRLTSSIRRGQLISSAWTRLMQYNRNDGGLSWNLYTSSWNY